MSIDSKIKWIAILLAFIIVVFAHPYYEYGTDGDDAIEIGARHILQLKTPYHLKTHLGQPLTPLPGIYILNLPSLLIGAHLFNFFWICLYARKASALNIILLLLIGGKTLVSGCDYVSNGCCVMYFISMVKTHFPVSSARVVTVQSSGSIHMDCISTADIANEIDRLGGLGGWRKVFNGMWLSNATVFLISGVLLLLPALWVSGISHHVILAMPFILTAFDMQKTQGMSRTQT